MGSQACSPNATASLYCKLVSLKFLRAPSVFVIYNHAPQVSSVFVFFCVSCVVVCSCVSYLHSIAFELPTCSLADAHVSVAEVRGKHVPCAQTDTQAGKQVPMQTCSRKSVRAAVCVIVLAVVEALPFVFSCSPAAAMACTAGRSAKTKKTQGRAATLPSRVGARQVLKKPASANQSRVRAIKRPAACPLAPAWASGGSSRHPRKGPIFVGELKDKQRSGTRGPQQTAKRGATMLARRVQRRPARSDYVPDHQKKPASDKMDMRVAAAAGELKLVHILQMTNRALIKSCRATGHLWPHQDCAHCGGQLGVLQLRRGSEMLQSRCGSCKKFTLPHAEHPIFAVAWGDAFVPLKTQVAILHCAVWGMPVSNVLSVLEGRHKQSVESIYAKWRHVLRNYVFEEQKSIKFGSSEELVAAGYLDEVEADAAVFRKIDADKLQVEWQEYHGTQRRGDRKSLALDKTEGARSSRGTRGWAVPPPTSNAQWGKIRARRVGRGILIHKDGARVYDKEPPGVYVDTAPHSGKNKCFAQTSVQTLADGSSHRSVTGTQSLDGWWKHGKRKVSTTPAASIKIVDHKLREAQWQHWIGNADRWVEAGKVISFIPRA